MLAWPNHNEQQSWKVILIFNFFWVFFLRKERKDEWGWISYHDLISRVDQKPKVKSAKIDFKLLYFLTWLWSKENVQKVFKAEIASCVAWFRFSFEAKTENCIWGPSTWTWRKSAQQRASTWWPRAKTSSGNQRSWKKMIKLLVQKLCDRLVWFSKKII